MKKQEPLIEQPNYISSDESGKVGINDYYKRSISFNQS